MQGELETEVLVLELHCTGSTSRPTDLPFHSSDKFYQLENWFRLLSTADLNSTLAAIVLTLDLPSRICSVLPPAEKTA
jgi:hypothetical protein